MPIMAIVDLVPGVVPIVLVVVPPVVGVEGQTHVREVHAGIGMPAIAETIAHDIGRRAAGRSSEVADGQDRAEGLRHLPLL